MYFGEAALKQKLIIAAFAGVGKNVAIKEWKAQGYKVDSIEKTWGYSDKFKSDEEFIDLIKQKSSKCDILFIPYFLGLDSHINSKIKYTLIYPKKSCKSAFLKRFKELEFTESQINNFVENWDDMIEDCKNSKCNKIEVSDKEFVLDKINP